MLHRYQVHVCLDAGVLARHGTQFRSKSGAFADLSRPYYMGWVMQRKSASLYRNSLWLTAQRRALDMIDPRFKAQLSCVHDLTSAVAYVFITLIYRC
jgi:hypothetical protein